MKEVARAIIINREGKVLLGKRARGTGAGMYALIGGKPNLGENSKNAIIREVQEEIGLKFLPTIYLEEVDSKSDPQEQWKVTYFTGITKGKPTLNLSEVTEIIYVSEKDIKNLDIAFNHKEKLQEYFKSKSELKPTKKARQ